ncbi:phospholipase D-like domain-containing protein [Plantactinospora endophytica]|uniref:PLD phosphodiesterase domain-containing protein n=1 Tax=Plantactinospora endophytica TaxID=673535 RepID=A0ABQ4EF51_9ACTN|nr:hypothetical protein [Plantactinospora endophytica]GIG93314.1 hypothetical protein Pen02_82500 [Plantactinospora endophytica]
MSEVTHAIRSPLTLLEQWRDRADVAPLREMVIIGYTVDLTFLEKFVIPTARGLGARITVLGDAGQSVHDPVDVRRAGRSYQHGHTVCARAFHPKLVVLVGNDDAVLAVGSGNPTLSGWGYNHELWVTARSSREVGPQLVADVADWLHDLPDVVRIASWIADTLRKVADQIRPGSVDERWSSIRAFGNLRQPLLDRLPEGPMAELRLAAPFYDPPAKAVEALVKRTKPRTVRIAVQPSIARFDGAALVQATASAASQDFRLIGQGPARHGKLIEWDNGDGTATGMTGSANITASALLMSTAQGGNCELAVIAPHTTPLLPDSVPEPATSIRTMTSAPPEPSSSAASLAPVLLGCALTDDTLLIELATATHQQVLIETSTSAGPGTWQAAGSMPHGERVARLLVSEPTIGAVRAVIDIDGQRHESAVVFVTDPLRCRPRRDTANLPRLSHPYQTDDIFTDPTLAQRFTTDLARLAGLTGSTTGTTPAPSTVSTSTAGAASDDRWADYLQACDTQLGPALTRLIFPHQTSSEQQTSASWSINDTIDSEVTEDEDEAVLDDLTHDQAASTPAVHPDQRHRYRRFAAKWAASVTGPQRRDADRSALPPMHLRMTVTALYLTLLAAGVWPDEDDEDWRRDLRWLIWALIPDNQTSDELPAEAINHLYTLLTVAMVTLRLETRLNGGREADMLATEAWREASEWIADADPELTEQRLLPASQPFAVVAGPRQLQDAILLAQAAKHDPYAEARATLADAGLTINHEENVWWVEGAGNAYRNAAHAVTELGRVSGHAVAVATSTRHTVLIALAGRTMALADSQTRFWRLYELTSTRTPLSLTAGNPAAPPGGRTLPPRPAVPAELQNLSNLVDADLATIAGRIRTEPQWTNGSEHPAL